MVESQMVTGLLDQNSPQALTKTQTQIDQQISMIRERIMTRNSLLRISNKYDLFKGSLRSMTSSELIDAMRDRIDVVPVSTDQQFSSQRNRATIAFILSYNCL